MGIITGILKRIIKIIIYVALVIALVLLIPNLPPYTKFTSIELEPSQPRNGVLAPNGDLNNVEKLYIDKLLGPESFQLWNGEVYTSLATGELVKVSQGGHVTFVAQIGQPCTGIVHEHICGRPLGFVIDDKNKQLYVADAYLGIWRVDLRSHKKQLLVSPRVAIGGRKPMLFNSVALAKNGDLYWTDSTSDYQLKDGAFAIISDPSGRFLRYNPAKNESTVILDDLWFPNGVAISPDNQFVLVVETNRLRVLKHFIDGPKKGTTEVFVSGLPGSPDTIRVLPDGSGVLVALYVAFDDEHPLLTKSLATTPLARKAAARLMRLLEIPFEFLNTHFPHIIFEQIVYTIGHFATISGFGPGLSGLVQVDWNGNIVASYDNRDYSVNHISDAIVYNDKLYLGSPHKQNFIGSVPAPPLLKKAFAVAKPSPASAKQTSPPTTPSPPPTKPSPPPATPSPPPAKPSPPPAKQSPPPAKPSPPPAKQSPPPAKQSPPPAKPAPEKEIPKNEQKIEKVKVTPQVEKPVEKKPSQTIKTEKPSSESDKIKTSSQKEAQVKSNAIPKDTVKQPVKEDTIKSTPKAAEVKPKTETPPKIEPKKEAASTSTVPESKPKVDSKIETKKESASEPKVAESKPKAVPKAEPKKDEPAKTVKSEKVTAKVSGQEESAPKVESPKPSTAKPQKVKTAKKAKKSQEEEPQIIVQKVVPDEIPIVEDIPSDTAKPKDESLKVIKKTGPTEIPLPNV